MDDLRRHIPNLISASRLVLAAVFPFAPATGRIWLCVLAALSDVLDGAVARGLDQDAPGGNIVDPTADKTFVLVVFLTFLFEGVLGIWEVVAIMARDVAVVGSVLVLLLRRRSDVVSASSARPAGKVTTVLQFAVFLALLVWRDPVVGLVAVTALVSLAAGIDYIVDYHRTARRLEHQPA